jgi:CheY-like chemotaxis protein
MIVLAVDDDYDDLDLFTEGLREVNPRIICLRAHNGQEALNILESNLTLPNFIFLDINMPVMDGITCLLTIRKNSKYDKIKVVVFSTAISEIDNFLCGKFHAECVMKPYNFQEFFQLLNAILTNKKIDN